MSIDFERNTMRIDTNVSVMNLLSKIGNDQAVANILSGLRDMPKRISPMYFYDTAGSKLFDEITRLPEYYLTRIEKELLRNAAGSMKGRMNQVDIIEIGSGSCLKISILLEAVSPDLMESVRYLPVDVSQAAIEKSVQILLENFPGLAIEAVVADFTRQLELIPRRERRIFCFFGSTIGNLSPEEADRFMVDTGKVMQPGDMLLLGLDMVKEKNVLEAAYNDSRQITARFNRNILKVMNDIADTDFDPNKFEHLAFYNGEEARIEMHLKATHDQLISSPHAEHPIAIQRGETIHTENSYKFTQDDIDRLASISGLSVEHQFWDRNRWFALVRYAKV